MASAMMERRKVGTVFHFFAKAGVAAVRVTDGEVQVGDRLQFQGPTTDFVETVQSLQVDKAGVPGVGAGQEVGIRVSQRCREGDLVYKL
jgi:translation initiation factor IF-2